jgi:hypothetical protein
MRLGTRCVRTVRKNGGVLEHPAGSLLFKAMKLPKPNEPADSYGGHTVYIEQSWFGYPSRKPTWLYIVGVPKDQVEPPAFKLTYGNAKSPALSKAARSRTMPTLAAWLVGIARSASDWRRCVHE